MNGHIVLINFGCELILPHSHWFLIFGAFWPQGNVNLWPFFIFILCSLKIHWVGIWFFQRVLVYFSVYLSCSLKAEYWFIFIINFVIWMRKKEQCRKEFKQKTYSLLTANVRYQLRIFINTYLTSLTSSGFSPSLLTMRNTKMETTIFMSLYN